MQISYTRETSKQTGESSDSQGLFKQSFHYCDPPPEQFDVRPSQVSVRVHMRANLNKASVWHMILSFALFTYILLISAVPTNQPHLVNAPNNIRG